jgi:hypothetical protein
MKLSTWPRRNLQRGKVGSGRLSTNSASALISSRVFRGRICSRWGDLLKVPLLNRQQRGVSKESPKFHQEHQKALMSGFLVLRSRQAIKRPAAFIHPYQPIVANQPYLMLYSFSTNRIEPVPCFT